MGGRRFPGEFLQRKQAAIDDIERRLLMTYLIEARYNVTAAARAAGMLRSAFQRMIRKHGIVVTILRREYRAQQEEAIAQARRDDVDEAMLRQRLYPAKGQ